MFNFGDGVDTIYDTTNPGKADTIQFGPGTALSDLSLSYSGNNLIINVGTTGDQIMLNGFDPTNALASLGIENFNFADSTSVGFADLINQGFDLVDTAGSDTLVGTNAENRIYGLGANDTLIAGPANDLLESGTGVDTMIGGAGNDTYIVNNPSDVVVGNSTGTGTIYSSVSYTLPAYVQNLTLTGTANINGTGNDLNDVITGNSGDNVLDDGGLGGADTLIGGTGNDTYIVNNSSDVVIGNPNGIGTIDSSVTYTLPANIQNLTLTGTANINGTGNNSDNVITANGGDDVLTGGPGNDTLIGGTGNDTFGYNIGDGLDTIVDTSGDNAILFGQGITQQNISVTSDPTSAHIRILDRQGNVTGQGLDLNLLANGSPAVQTLQFADGTTANVKDYLVQTIYGTDGPDLIQTGNANTVVYAGKRSDTIIAGSGNDTIYGGPGDDVIDAGTGDDLIIGGPGNDTLNGGPGNDTYVFNPGDGVDTINDTALPGAGKCNSVRTRITLNDLSLSYSGNKLIINVGTLGSVAAERL